jgi:hypothetical protein
MWTERTYFRREKKKAVKYFKKIGLKRELARERDNRVRVENEKA